MVLRLHDRRRRRAPAGASIYLPVYAIFGMLGALLGMAFFKKKLPPAAAPPVPPPAPM